MLAARMRATSEASSQMMIGARCGAMVVRRGSMDRRRSDNPPTRQPTPRDVCRAPSECQDRSLSCLHARNLFQ